jgi:hypothetical protein
MTVIQTTKILPYLDDFFLDGFKNCQERNCYEKPSVKIIFRRFIETVCKFTEGFK